MTLQPNRVMRLPQRNQEEFSFELKWAELRMGLVLIFENFEQGITNEMWLDCYSIVYKICAFHKEYTQTLYQQLVNFCAQYTKSLTRFIVGVNETHDLLDKHSISNLGIIDRYCSLWMRYQTSSLYASQIFKYMSNVWARLNSNVRDIFSLVLSSWRDNVYNSVKETLQEKLLEEIILQRKNEISNYSNISSLISTLINNFIELGLEDGKLEFYKHEFEEPFLSSTSNYYYIYSTSFLENNSVTEYMKKVEEILEYEKVFAKQHLHPSTEQEVVNTCKKSLIDKHFAKILDGFQAMLRNQLNSAQDLKRVYQFSKHLPDGLKELALYLKQWASNIFKNITRDQTQSLNAQSSIKNAIPLMHSILALHRKCKEMISECFEDNAIFSFKMDEAFSEFLNKPIGIFKMPELICMFCDRLLCGKEKISGDIFDDTLERLVKIFCYLNEKDLFHESYRRNLCRRLLTRSNRINEEMESAMISNIKLNCGSQFTSKLEGMFNDIILSNEINDSYRSSHSSTPSSSSSSLTTINDDDNNNNHNAEHRVYAELYVNVLNSLNWPISPSEGSKPLLPLLFDEAKHSFETFYKRTTPNKNLIWIYHEGTVSLTCHLHRKVELVLSTYQAAIMLLFNEQNTITIEEIKTRLNLKMEEISYCLYPLIHSKFPLLFIDGKFQELLPHYTLKLNLQIGVKMPLKLHFPPGSSNIVEKEAHTTRNSVNQDRRYQIDAGIMRLMKSRRIMNFNELLVEVSKQLVAYFSPDSKLVKQRIQALIEQEFLEKDISQPDMYKYLA